MRIRSIIFWAVILVVALYSVAWVFISRSINTETNKYIQQLKKDNVIDEYDGNIEISGFPFSFNIKFVHPRVKSTRFKSDVLFDGVLEAGLNLFSSKIRVRLNGDIHIKTNLNGNSFDLIMSSKELLHKISLSDSLIMLGIKFMTGRLALDKQSPMDIIRYVNFETEDLSLVNKLSNKALFYSNSCSFKFNLKSSSDYKRIKIAGNLVDTEFSEEFNGLSRSVGSIPCIRSALNQLDANVRNYFDVFTLDRFGKINDEFDLYIDLDKSDITIDINTLVLDDALHKVNLSGGIKYAKKISINGKFAGEFSRNWYELMKVYANKVNLEPAFKHSYSPRATDGSVFAIMFNAVAGFIKDTFIGGTAHTAYVPKMHEVGKITSNVNVIYQPTSRGFNMNLNKFDFKTNKYSINASGSIDSQGGSDIYNIKSHLTNYEYIVDEASGYINRVLESSGRVFFLFKKPFNLSPPITKSIKLLLRNVSDAPDDESSNLSLTIINKDGGKYPAVGKYTSNEFKVVWNNFVYKILFMQIAENIDVRKLAGLLKDPLNIPLNVTEGTTETVRDIAKGVLGLFGVGK